MDRTKRIQEMEEKLKLCTAAVQGLADALETYKTAPLAELAAYYHSPAWQEDYAADERGELPPGLKRGVLAQDTVYDLLTAHDELLEELRALLQSPQE